MLSTSNEFCEEEENHRVELQVAKFYVSTSSNVMSLLEFTKPALKGPDQDVNSNRLSCTGQGSEYRTDLVRGIVGRRGGESCSYYVAGK